MAELAFFSGTMDCGKSTLALQMDHNHRARGRSGLIFTKMDRMGESVLSSRLGLSTDAHEVTDEVDFWDSVVEFATTGHVVDYLICDEAQFYTPAQVEQLAKLVDEMAIDVFAFGITADFRTQLFPGSRRMIELAFLAPDITTSILDGRQPIDLTTQRLITMYALPIRWTEQRRLV